MPTYEIETTDGSVYQIDTEEPVTSKVSTPKTSLVGKTMGGIGSYLKEAQPAFKFAVQHPYELLKGTAQNLPPEAFRDKPWSDIYREANLPLSKSKTTAGQLVPEIAGTLLDIGTRPSSYVGGEIFKGRKAIGQHAPDIMNKNYPLQRAVKGAKALDDMRTAIGMAKKEAVAKVSDVAVADFKPQFSDDILKKLQDPIYEIAFKKGGAIEPTIGNLDKVLESLGDMMTGKGWVEATKKSQQAIKQAYGYVATMMRDTVPEIKAPIEAYSSFMKQYGVVNKTIRDASGNIVEKRLRGAFSPGSERQAFETWKGLATQNPEIKQMVKDMGKWATRQQVKKWGSVVAGGAAGTYLLHRYLGEKMFGRQQ